MAPQEGGDPSDAILSHAFGVWVSDDDRHEQLIVSPASDTDRGAVRLDGMHSDWNGHAAVDSVATRTVTLRATRHPTAGEMSPAAPDWARQKVEGKLEWVLQARVAYECADLALVGRWYPGEIAWEEVVLDSGTTLSRDASVCGQGEPRQIRYLKSDDDQPPPNDCTGGSFIFVRPAGMPSTNVSADSVTKDQPFFVELRLARDKAKTVGPTATVTLTSFQGGATSSLLLSSDASAARGHVVYTHDEPVTLSGGGAGAAKMTVGGLEFGGSSGGLTQKLIGGMRPVATENGDTVWVEFGDEAHTRFVVFNSWVQEGIARYRKGLHQRGAVLKASFDRPGLDRAKREEVHQKLRLIENADVIMGRRDLLSDQKIYFIGQRYLEMLDGWREDLNGQGGRAVYSTDGTQRYSQGPEWLYGGGDYSPAYGIVWTCLREMSMVVDALYYGSQALFYGYTDMWKTLAIGLYQFTVSMTGADAGVAILFGMDAMGNPVSTVERVLAGVTLLAPTVLLTTEGMKVLEGWLDRITLGSELPLKDIPPSEPGGLGERAVALSGQRCPPNGVLEGEAAIARPGGSNPVHLDYAAWGPVREVDGPSTLVQRMNNTCGLNAVDTLAIQGGGLAYQQEVISQQQAFSRGWIEPRTGGTYPEQVACYARFRGARAVWTQGVMEGRAIDPLLLPFALNRQIRAGRSVIIQLETGGRHWVIVWGFERDAAGKLWVKIGDPWTGGPPKAMECRIFIQQAHPQTTVLVDFGSRPEWYPPGYDPVRDGSLGGPAPARGGGSPGPPPAPRPFAGEPGSGIKPARNKNWKTVDIDAQHIRDRHTWGGAGITDDRDVFPPDISNQQLDQIIRQAYKDGRVISWQNDGSRVLMTGPWGDNAIEFWYNTQTQTIETAYPKWSSGKR